MIEKVKNLTKKSYYDYTGPDISFVKNNIIYGENGNGKTSFAEGLYEQSLQKYTYDQVYFFDKEYVKRNIIVEDSESLRGVKVSFGEGNILVGEEIHELNKRKKEITNKISELEKENIDLNNFIKKEIRKVFKDKKGNAAIQQKSGILNNIIHVYNRWIKDYKKAKIDFPDFVFSEGYDANELESKQNEINESQVSIKLDDLPKETISNIKKIMNKSYISDVKDTQLLDWLEKGMDIHRELPVSSDCQFCGNEFNNADRFEEINKLILDDTKKDMDYLVTYLDKLKKIKENLKNFNINSVYLRTDDKINDLFNLFTKESEFIIENIGKCTREISEKMKDMRKIFLDFNPELNLGELKSVEQKMKDRRQEIISEIADEINKESDIVKGVIGYELNSNSLLSSQIKNFNGNLQSIEKLNEIHLQDINSKITDKKAEKENIEDFRIETNKLLAAQGISIELIIEGEDYCIQNKYDNSKKISIEDISEGEKSLLVFLYFYISLYGGRNKFKDIIKMIIIDDPISSLDQNNKMLITVLLEEILSESKSQNFIFTHSWEDYSNLVYGIHNNKSYETYECVKKNGESKLIEFRGNETLYKRLFKQVYQFSEDEESINYEENIIHQPNAMRRILESYLRFNYLVQNATIRSVGEIKDVFHRVKFGKRQDVKIKILLKVVNILSHGSGHELLPNNKEIHESAKYLMFLFKEHDIKHFSRMTN